MCTKTNKQTMGDATRIVYTVRNYKRLAQRLLKDAAHTKRHQVTICYFI